MMPSMTNERATSELDAQISHARRTMTETTEPPTYVPPYTVRRVDTPRGTAYVVPCGSMSDHWLDRADATRLRDALTAALADGDPAMVADHGAQLTDREAMVWAAAFDRLQSGGHRLLACTTEAALAVQALRNADAVCGPDLDDDARAMLAAMTGGGR